MRLATVRTPEGTSAAVINEQSATLLDARDVSEVLAGGNFGDLGKGSGGTIPLADVVFETLIPRPRSIWCIGLNYASHVEETGAALPEYPAVFTKMPTALIGAYDDIRMPPASTSEQIDWEAELVVVIGSEVRRANEAEAKAAIGGYTVGNDMSVRDWQLRTTQWTLGKTFEGMSPVGPWLVTPNEFGEVGEQRITCTVDDEVVQDSVVGDLVFKPAMLVSHLSQVTTLFPGDLIFTGTPSGVALFREGQPWIKPGAVIRTHIDGIGDLVNKCVIC